MNGSKFNNEDDFRFLELSKDYFHCYSYRHRLHSNNFGSFIRSVSTIITTGINYQWYFNIEKQTTS